MLLNHFLKKERKQKRDKHIQIDSELVREQKRNPFFSPLTLW